MGNGASMWTSQLGTLQSGSCKNMVKIWGLEAMFHGADVFSVFRWRQAKYAQEQNHSGILDFADQMTSGGQELADLYTQIQELGIKSTLELPKKLPWYLITTHTGSITWRLAIRVQIIFG